MTVEEQVVAKLRTLTSEKQKEVLAFIDHLDRPGHTPRRQLAGLWQDLNVSVNEEDISKARHELWGGFPRDIS